MSRGIAHRPQSVGSQTPDPSAYHVQLSKDNIYCSQHYVLCVTCIGYIPCLLLYVGVRFGSFLTYFMLCFWFPFGMVLDTF